jgi:hypothetical protein
LRHAFGLYALVVDDLFDVGEKNLCDLPVIFEDFDCRFAEGLGAAQVVNFAANAATVVSDYLYVFALEDALQFFHHREEISHGFPLSTWDES